MRARKLKNERGTQDVKKCVRQNNKRLPPQPPSKISKLISLKDLYYSFYLPIQLIYKYAWECFQRSKFWIKLNQIDKKFENNLLN